MEEGSRLTHIQPGNTEDWEQLLEIWRKTQKTLPHSPLGHNLIWDFQLPEV
jgi:hypothetical protein